MLQKFNGGMSDGNCPTVKVRNSPDNPTHKHRRKAKD